MKTHYLSYFKNILYREPFFILKYYLHKRTVNPSNEYVFMADGKMIHGGLFDRLKGAVSVYALSIVHKKRFSICFTHPFLLEKYLEPNLYKWNDKFNQVIYTFPYSRPIIAYSEIRHPFRMLKKRKAQTHFYFGGNILDAINKKYGTNFKWGVLYHDLFKPSVKIERRVKEIKESIGTSYVTVHLRFLNLLGDKMEDAKYKTLTNVEQRDLCNVCICKIQDIARDGSNIGKKVVVMSDSMTFLMETKERLPFVYVDEGNVKHIDRAGLTNDEDVLKLLSDVYLIAGADNVYSIVGRGLYHSAFPEYAALIGNVNFERLFL